MANALRLVGTALAVLSILFLVLALLDVGAKPAEEIIVAPDGQTGPAGELDMDLFYRDRVISGAYKVYGLKDNPLGLWLAKAVLTNDTGGTVRDLKIRYKLGEYCDWTPWQKYPEVVHTQTVVDLFHPILSSKCAKLNAKTPAVLQVQAEYTDASGQPHTLERSARLTMLGRRDYLPSDLKLEERTGVYQDNATNDMLLAAYVTPEDTAVSGLASLANERSGGLGAGSSGQNTFKVMRELYEIMRTLNVTYQHPSSNIEPDQSYNMFLVQSLQYPRDTIRKRSGTCIDLAILYAAMMQSVGIRPVLVTLRGHCFPMGDLGDGQYIPVETTLVGGGGKKSHGFEQAVEYGMKQWRDLQQSGEYVLVPLRDLWGAGVTPPELDPLPADVLERWNVIRDIRQAWTQQDGQGPAGPGAQTAGGNGGGQTTPPPAGGIQPGQWAFRLQANNGQVMNGVAVVQRQGANVILTFGLQYPITGPDGQQHQAREINKFVGQMQGNTIVAQCNEAQWTLDGQPVQPQGLPYRLQLQLANNGRAAQGVVSGANGQVQIVMQLNQQG